MSSFTDIFKEEQVNADRVIRGQLETIKEETFPLLYEAMQYALFTGGKRVRPILLKWCAENGAPDMESVNRAMAAIEYIHTYSLIHDDLPAMDDDDVRRGMATVHKKYSEAIAVLAGDALLTEAFVLISGTGRPELCRELGYFAGARGMAGGQAADIEGFPDSDYVNELKTAYLFKAAAVMGAICGGIEGKTLDNIADYGINLGRAFQLRDNILDDEEDDRVAALAKASEYIEKAKSMVSGLDNGARLAEFSDFMIKRNK